MGSLQRVLAQVMARMRDTNMSQRAALILGGALVGVSLLWLAQWAARPEMIPLLEQDFQPEEITQVTSGLELVGEPFEVRGNRIFVRAGANRQALLAQLQQQEKLPDNTSAGFAALVQESDPWISQAENERRWTFALQTELAQVLQQFQGVKKASVFLNFDSRRGFSRQPPAKSASVTLMMQGGEPVSRALAMAAARLVSGAVAGLRVQDVSVVDGSGAPALDWEIENDIANKLNRHLVREERRYREKIREQVPDPKALVSVQVELDTTAVSSETEQPLKGTILTEEIETESTTRIRSREGPGVQPNTGVAIGSGAADENHERERSKVENRPGITRTVEDKPPGAVRAVAAAISLSYSYLESVCRQENPGVDDVTPELIDQTFEGERRRLVQNLTKLVKPQDEANVAISRYYDGAVEPLITVPTTTLDQTIGLVQRFGPQSGLALLALVSLGLMLRLARRTDHGESFGLELGLPAEAIEAARQAAADMGTVVVRSKRGGPGGAEGRGGGDAHELAGYDAGDLAETIPQASATEGMLVAQEVDAATVQIRKMLDQVMEMVDEDPAVVAQLVEQWIQRCEQYSDDAGEGSG